MSFDAVYYSREAVDHQAMVKAARKWANRNPFFEISGGDDFTQLSYENPDTFVDAIFDIRPPDADESDEAENEGDPKEAQLFAGLHRTGCSVSFNYLRPSFFADELVPLAVEFAKAIGALIHDPQDMTVLEPDAFATSRSYARHLKKINASFVRDPRAGVELKQMDGALLQAFWRQNFSKDELQDELGQMIFVPTMLMVELKGGTGATTAFTWTRALPLAVEPSGVVLLHREVKAWLKSSVEYRIATFDAFRNAVSNHIRINDGLGTKLLMEPSDPAALETSFDRLFNTLPKLKDLKDAISARFGGVVGVVDAVEG